LNGIIYARYSSDNQREESIEGQIRECKEYAERNGIKVIGTYIDRALSAKTDNRPEFQRMIKESSKGLFELVIVWKLDRFARNRYDSAHYKSILRKNGVKVVSAKEVISEGPEGIILESMLEGLAEYYSVELSVKVKRGQAENALKAKYNGGPAPLGYMVGKDHKLEINPITAPFVTEAFTRYANGEKIKDIAESFNQQGLRTRQNTLFRINSFDSVFRNRAYLGEYKYGDVVIPDSIPAIVSEELFDRVQDRKAKNKRAPARTKALIDYLLTTKLFCGECGRMFAGESGTSHTGKKHHYYKCSGTKKKLGCHSKMLKKDWLENIVVTITANRVLQDEIIDRIADKLVLVQEENNPLLPSMRQQLNDVNKGIQNLLNAIQQGLFNTSAKLRMDELEAQKEDLEASILQAELAQPKYTKEQIVLWISRLKNGAVNDLDYQRKIIDIFVNSVRVFEDRMLFIYNYRDGTETVTTADIKTAFGLDFSGSRPPFDV